MVILIYDQTTDMYFPVCFILCSHKNQDIYQHILKEIALNVLQNDFKVTRVTLDFETAAIEAFKSIFSDVELIGCKFHLQQALIRKAKKKGLMNESYIKETNDILYQLNQTLESQSVDFVGYLNSLESRFEMPFQELHENPGKI